MDSETITRFERVESDIKELFARTTDTIRWQGEYGNKIDNIESSINKMTANIETLLKKPQQRWDAIVMSAISAIVGSGVTLMFASMISK